MVLVNPFLTILNSMAILKVYYRLFLPVRLHPAEARQGPHPGDIGAHQRVQGLAQATRKIGAVDKFLVEVRSMQPAVLFSD